MLFLIPYIPIQFVWTFWIKVYTVYFLYPICFGLSDFVAPMGGGLRSPPLYIKTGVIFDPMLLYSICLFVYLGSHAIIRTKISKFEQDFRISKNFEIEILHHIDKVKILKIQDPSFCNEQRGKLRAANFSSSTPIL